MATYNNGNTSPYASIARYVVERDTFLRGKASRGISIALQPLFAILIHNLPFKKRWDVSS